MFAHFFIKKSKSEFHKLLTKKDTLNIKVFKYVAAILITLLGILCKIILKRTVHYPEGGFLISTGTIMLSAWYGGFGPGVIAVFVNYFIIDWFFITPQALFFQDSLPDQIRIVLFLTEGILISWLFELLHRAHKKTKELLLITSQNEKLFRSLVENIADHAIFMVDAKGHIQTWSRGAAIMTGYQTEEVLDKPVSILFPKKNVKDSAFLKGIHIAAAKGQYKEEGWKTRKGESSFWAETIVTSLPSISPTAQKFSIIIHDITARKKTDELKSELLSIISHELRTPVAIMKVIIESMVRDHAQKELWDLQGEVDRLTMLVGNILDIARLRTKKFSLHYENIELSSLIEKLMNKMQFITGDHIALIFHKPGAITVSVDQVKIEQVLMNLLDNAIRFTPKKGKIEISAKIVSNMAVVSIFNETATVIPKEKFLLIFDKFYQLTKKPVKGLGLGLYISREIIKRHGGKMWVSSQKGKGNTFSFSLPLS